MGLRFRMPSMKLEVEGAEGREAKLENDDLLPTPLENRTWGFWTFTMFWFSAVGTPAKWLGANTFLTFGISLWDGILCQFFGFLIVGIFMAFNGRAGSVYHISFPVLSRSSFGVYGALWPVFNRALSACVWNGVNNVTGGQCIYVMLHAIFPGIANIPNKMPASSGINSGEMICFFIFWLVCIPPLTMSIRQWPILIKIKLVAYFLSCIGMLALALVAADGVGDTLTAKPKVTGSARAWLIVRFTLLATASCATFASNAADWMRNATKPKDPIFGQIFGFPMSNFVTTLVGMIVAVTSTRVTGGKIMWNPIQYMDLLLTRDYTPATRAGCFFVGLGFTYSCVFSSVFQNIYPAGNDIASLAPKYITVKRGFAVCMIMTVAINPWYLMGSAGVFVSFIGSYQIFLFSITGILLCDYYLVQRGKLDLKSLYTAERDGSYWYTYGVNWRAMVAYVVGAAINFAGFLDNMGVKGFSTSLKRSFFFAWITSLVGAALTYYLLARFFPQRSYTSNAASKWVWGEWTQDKVEAWSSARRLGDREGAEMVEQEEKVMESEIIMDREDEKEVEAVGDGSKRDKSGVTGVAVLEA